MQNKHLTHTLSSFAGILLAAMTVLASCGTAKQMHYFNNLPEAIVTSLPAVPREERVIEAGDRLLISIDTRDKVAAGFFNKSTAAVSDPGVASPAAAPALPGYTVDETGAIEMPVLGRMRVTGMNMRQLKDSLFQKVSPYLKDPLVEVAFTSFRVTVIGEVRSPGTFNLPLQRTTLFEALAAAGDLPLTARRYNVHLYRDYNGRRTITKFDLRDKSVLTNPDVFVLKPNDVLYVQPRPGSIFRDDFGLPATIVAMLLSIVTLGVTVSK